MSPTPSEIRAAFDALSDEGKRQTGLVSVKTNRSWKPIREAVIEYLKNNDSFSLQDLRDEGIIFKATKSHTFRQCVIEPLRRDGYEIEEQKGALPRNAILYHLPGKLLEVKATEQIVFERPSKAAAKYVAEHIINGQLGSINVRKVMDRKQFPFITHANLRKRFIPLLVDEAEKLGCKQTGTPFVFVREASQ